MRFKLFFWFWPDEPGRSARESVGSWLHGVTLRVTARARVVAIRRKIRDRQATLAAQSIAALVSDQTDMPTIERQEDAEIVHRELNRLPEKYRAPIVLCYLEGLTHDEAATQLCWPVGTVCSRLARARDTLRSRLARRGVTAQATFGPMASWIVGGSQEPIGAAATLSSETISRDLRRLDRPYRDSTAGWPDGNRYRGIFYFTAAFSRSYQVHDVQETADGCLRITANGG